MLALSLLYALGRGVPVIDGALFGIKAAVLVIVVEALIRIGKRALKTSLLLGIAGAAFVGIFFFALPFPIIVIAAALVGFLAARSSPALLGLKDDVGTLAPPRARSLAAGRHRGRGRPRRLVGAGCCWRLPCWVPNHVLVSIGVFFSKLAVVSFGGAYALLAYMAQQAVETHRWMTAPEMVDGLGLAETTPGPLILVTQFVGFLAALRDAAPFSAGRRRHSRRRDDDLGHVRAVVAVDFRRRAVHRAICAATSGCPARSRPSRPRSSASSSISRSGSRCTSCSAT